MEDEAAAETLNLFEAVGRWSDQTLVEAVREQEREFYPARLEHYYSTALRWRQLSPDSKLKFRDGRDHTQSRARDSALNASWRALLHSFKSRLVSGELYIQGMQTRPKQSDGRVPIERLRAFDYNLDLNDSRLSFSGLTYVAVQVSDRPFADAGATPAVRVPDPSKWTPEDAAQLSPDVVAKLIELHAEHVRKGLRLTLAMPGKASPVPLAASMMRHRAQTGQLLSMISGEIKFLEGWIGNVAPSLFSTSHGALKSKLSSLHEELVKNSKAGGRTQPAGGEAAPDAE